MRDKAKSILLGSSSGNWCMASDGSEITAARYSHSSAMKGDCKFPFTCLLTLWLHDRNRGKWGSCSGTMLMEKLISCSEAQENPELEEFGSCVSVLSVLLQCCPAKCFRISCSVRELRERRKKRLSCHFPFSVCLPAPGDETCQWLLPEVPVPCEGWQRGLQQWLGVALTDTLAEGPRPRADTLCYELSGKVLVWEVPATSSGLGDIYEQAASGGCFTC